MKYQYKPKRLNNNIVDQMPLIDWNIMTVKCPCSKSKGFKRRDHFQNHINTKQHERWIYNFNKDHRENIQTKKNNNNYFILKFTLVYFILMFYWFEPLRTWLIFNFLEGNANEPIYETMTYDEIYNRYLNHSISFGGITISW